MEKSKPGFLVILTLGMLFVLMQVSAQPRHKIHANHLETRSGEVVAEGDAANETREPGGFKNQNMWVDRDTCIMAVMHHARKINEHLKRSELVLKATVGRAPHGADPTWAEKPQLNRAGSTGKIENALRSLKAAQRFVSPLAGRNGDHYAVATVAAQARCENGLELAKLDATLSKIQQELRSLFDNGYIEMKESNFEGFSEAFLSPIFDANQEMLNLAAVVTTKPKRRLFGLLASAKPFERAQSKIENLQIKLRKKYPSAFSPGKTVPGSDKAKQMLAANAEIVQFLQRNEISYSDAASFWKSGLVRDVTSKSAPESSAAYVDDLIIDKITR